MFKIFVVLGSIGGFLSVALGAFGAHGLKDVLPPNMLENYQTAVQYQMMHSLGLICIAILSKWLSPSALLRWAGWMLLAGIIIFSGSLYILSITGITSLGAITPFGGVAFLLGWLFVTMAVLKEK